MADTSDDELLQIDNPIDTGPLRMATTSDFQRLHNAISTSLTKFNNKTTDLEGLVKKLGTPEDSEPLRDRYIQLQNETKILMQQINTDLKQLKEISLGNDADKRKRQALIDTLPKQYIATMTRFQEAQRTGARKEKESLDRARAVSYYQNNTHDSQFNDNSTPSNGGYQKQVVLPMEQDVDMQGLRERDEQLRQVERNIVTLNELFKDVATMVHEHGDIIDSIGEHTVETERHVEEGTKKLGQAVEYQTAARRKKIILYLILIIILAILALILGLYFGLKKN